MNRSWGAPVFLFLWLGLATAASPQDEPLHARIDGAIESSHVGAPAPSSDDATFLRRVTLDLTGAIPTAAEARAFLADTSPDKRRTAIDRLLASPGYVRHMATTFDVMLMERRRDKYVKADPWRKYLVESFASNKPYDRLVREILGADGTDPKMHAAAKFYLEREVEPNALTRDVGRMFFGMDLQCAQCHDHPRIEDYVQRDYYGLYAFLSRSYLFHPDKKKPAVLAEKAEGNVAFKSVFTNAEGTTRPRLPGGREIDEPTFKKGEEYKVKPDKKKKTLRPVPKYSRLAQLAKHATDGRNRAFSRNAVNRLWAHMMGRGLVEPADLHHSGNPPVNPAVLELLADAFVAMKYDIRGFLRELALTRTYQRSFEMPKALAREAKTAAGRLGELEAGRDRLEKSVEAARAAVDRASEELAAARKRITVLEGERSRAVAGVGEAKKAVAAATKERDAMKKALAPKLDLLRTIGEAADKSGAAAAKLPEDKELAAAAKTFEVRKAKMAGEMEAARKELAGKEAVLKGAGKKQAAAEKTVRDLAAKIAGAEKEFASLEGRRAEAIARKKAESVAARHAARRLAAAQALVDYGRLYEAARASAGKADRLTSELAAARNAGSERPKREAELKAAEETAAKAETDLADIRKKLPGKEETARVLAEAAAKAEAVKTKAPKDAELGAAAAKVKARSGKARAELADLKKVAAGRGDAAGKAKARVEALRKRLSDLKTLQSKLPELERQAEPAERKADADLAKRDSALRELTSRWADDFAVGGFGPLTPEQLCWSMLQATGQRDLQRAAGEREFDKKNKDKDGAKRASFADQYAYDKLRANVVAFVKLYGAAAGQPQDGFFATADQALFLANGGNVRGWLSPARGSLTERLNRTEDPKALAEELYLSVLTRLPTSEETAEVRRHLDARPKQKGEAVQELVWALLSSVEFRFRH